MMLYNLSGPARLEPPGPGNGRLVPMRPKSTPEQRFWAKVDRRGPDECWPWVAYCKHHGYGLFYYRGRDERAHRVAYEFCVGPIPPGMDIDHLCRNPSCVNPNHLEPVTHRANCLRGESFSAQNARKTHCVHGHEFTPENIYIRQSDPNRRACLTCIRESNRRNGVARRDQRREARLAVKSEQS